MQFQKGTLDSYDDSGCEKYVPSYLDPYTLRHIQ